MKEIVNCCGAVCSECQHYQKECQGCPEIKGQAYWLEYMPESNCAIFECCKILKQYPHCGKCSALPCNYYDLDDPAKSVDENAKYHRKRIERLKKM